MEVIKWDIYEITAASPITGVMLRGRIRKLCLKNNKNVLVENAKDIEGAVRFAIPAGEEVSMIITYLNKVLPDIKVEKVRESIPNPILSKLKVNLEDRYTL
mgnify:CR=1 FL=1